MILMEAQLRGWEADGCDFAVCGTCVHLHMSYYIYFLFFWGQHKCILALFGLFLNKRFTASILICLTSSRLVGNQLRGDYRRLISALEWH